MIPLVTILEKTIGLVAGGYFIMQKIVRRGPKSFHLIKTVFPYHQAYKR